MAQRPDEIQYLMDRAAIEDVIRRYFQGLDRCNAGQVRTCFTEDIVAHYDQRPPVRGIEELMGGFQTFKRMKEGRMKVTTHFMGNLNFSLLQGDVAETETNAIAFLVAPGEDAGVVNMRSLRYIDKLRRQGDGWRISERIHTLDWSCQMPASFATTLAQRVSVLPVRT